LLAVLPIGAEERELHACALYYLLLAFFITEIGIADWELDCCETQIKEKQHAALLAQYGWSR
jgi:hypothetical protein